MGAGRGAASYPLVCCSFGLVPVTLMVCRGEQHWVRERVSAGQGREGVWELARVQWQDPDTPNLMH